MVDVSNINLQAIGVGISSTGGVVLNVILVLVLLGLIAFLWWNAKKYNYMVTIFTKGTRIIGIDRGTVVKRKDGQQYFKLKKTRGVELPIPNFDIALFTAKKKYVYLFRVSENTYFFINPVMIEKIEDTIDLKKAENIFQAVPTAARNWAIQSMKRTAEKFQKPGFWEKYGGTISIGIVVVAMIIGLWIVAGMVTDTVNSIPGIVEAGIEAGKTTVTQGAY